MISHCMSSMDSRSASHILGNFEAVFLSKVEPITIETKLYCLERMRADISSFVGCEDVFDEIKLILEFLMIVPLHMNELHAMMQTRIEALVHKLRVAEIQLMFADD